MIKLDDITQYYRKRYRDDNPHHNVIVYPSFNAVTAFIKNIHTNTFICLYCYSRYFTNNRSFKIRTLADKTPVEFLQEAFYYNKISYLPIKVKSKAITSLMKHYHFSGIIKNNIKGVEIVRALLQVNNDNQIIPAFNNIFKNYLLLFNSFLKNPKKFFVVKDYSKASSKTIKKLKRKIYDLDFKK